MTRVFSLVRAHSSFNLMKTSPPCKDLADERIRGGGRVSSAKALGAGIPWSMGGAAKRLQGLGLSGCWANRRRGHGRSKQGWITQALGWGTRGELCWGPGKSLEGARHRALGSDLHF